MRVPFTNLAIPPMDEQLSLLVLGYLATCINRLLLSPMDGSGP